MVDDKTHTLHLCNIHTIQWVKNLLQSSLQFVHSCSFIENVIDLLFVGHSISLKETYISLEEGNNTRKLSQMLSWHSCVHDRLTLLGPLAFIYRHEECISEELRRVISFVLECLCCHHIFCHNVTTSVILASICQYSQPANISYHFNTWQMFVTSIAE